MGKYDDIIALTHPEPRTHGRMPRSERAAQFSPFAALTGYEDAVEETARYTESCTELTEDAKSILNEKLRMLHDHLPSKPTVRILYFVPDAKKSGGAYVRIQGKLRAIDSHARIIVMEDRTSIQIEQIRELESNIFGTLGFP